MHITESSEECYNIYIFALNLFELVYIKVRMEVCRRMNIRRTTDTVDQDEISELSQLGTDLERFEILYFSLLFFSNRC